MQERHGTTSCLQNQSQHDLAHRPRCCLLSVAWVRRSTWPPAKTFAKNVSTSWQNLTHMALYAQGTETSCERNVRNPAPNTCWPFVTVQSGSRYKCAHFPKYTDSDEIKLISNAKLQETISFSEDTFTGLLRSTRRQHNAPPVGVKIQPHRVISRHHLVQFFCNPNEIFFSRHRCIYSTGSESKASIGYFLKTVKCGKKVWIRCRSDFTHGALHSAQRRVLLRDPSWPTRSTHDNN